MTAWRNPKPRYTPEQCAEFRAGARATRRAAQDARGGGAEHLQGFEVTHALVYEGEIVGTTYRYRGVYYTLEQWTHGEPGLRLSDLREGETLAKV